MWVSTCIYLLLTTIATEVSCDCGSIALQANPSDANKDGIGAEIFPWLLAIYQENADHSLHRWCFGNLISSDVVMTAARCISQRPADLHQFYVVTGEDTPYTIPQDRKIRKTRIEALHVGKGYDAWNGQSAGDVVWLVLEHPLNVTPACMDLENQQDTEQLPVGLVGQIFYRPSVDDMGRAEIRRMEVFDSSHNYCYRFFPEVRRHNVSLNPSCARLLNETSSFFWFIGSGFYSQYNGRWYLRAIITDVYVTSNNDGRHNIALMMNVQRFVGQMNRSGAIKRCGIAAPPVHPLIINGFKSELGQYPWHVGVYRQNSAGLYNPICGGSLISTKVVLSAAHCFFDEVRRRQHVVSGFAVAGGKLNRLYDSPEQLAQKSPIKTIRLPSKYYGSAGNYAEDIAWLILWHPFYHSALVTPVCIDFDNSHQNEDLRDGQLGKVAGWGRTAADVPSNELQEINVPFVPHEKCILALPQEFIPFITSDKFCAGYTNGTRLCDGDSGGGLVFSHGGTWYLRGIVSVGPPSVVSTCAASYTVFTNVGRFNDEHRRVMETSARESN